jgi:hypothetical protein
VLWTEEIYRENYRRAAVYYSMYGDMESALVYYQKAGMHDQVKNLLIQNAQRHPGKGHYYQVKDYYMALPEDVIADSPVLMCGMSMLHSMMFQPGLVNIALAESGFEKNTMESYDLLTRLHNGYRAADAAGNIEMCFAATGVLVRRIPHGSHWNRTNEYILPRSSQKRHSGSTHSQFSREGGNACGCICSV